MCTSKDICKYSSIKKHYLHIIYNIMEFVMLDAAVKPLGSEFGTCVTRCLDRRPTSIGKPKENGGLMGCNGIYPLVICYIAIEHGHSNSEVSQKKMVIFHGDVKITREDVKCTCFVGLKILIAL